jgi:streptogramin lyase
VTSLPGTERSAAVTWTDAGQLVWTHDPGAAELHRIRAEIDRFADAIIPMMVWGIHDMAGLDLTLLRTYLAAERGRSG